MLKLIIEDDEGRKTVVPFVRDEITIGRQEGNTIRLTERNVSRRHARLVRLNGHVVLEDLGSYNGTRINGERVAGQLPLKEGDLIQIGDYDLALQVEGAANAAAPTGAITAKVPASRRPEPEPEEEDDDDEVASGPRPRDTMVDGEDEADDHGDSDDEHDHTPVSADARRNATSIIRMDQMEADRPRRVERVPEDEQPRLVVLGPAEFKGQEFDCNRTELRIGRTSENDVALDHRSLSRTHAKVVREETGEWRVIDMQSANGMTVNGESYAQATLAHGDIIEMGHVKLRFVGPGSLEEDIAAQGRGGSKKLWVAAVIAFLSIGAGAALFVVKGQDLLPKPPDDTPPVVAADPQPIPEAPPQTKPPETKPPETVAAKPPATPDTKAPDAPKAPESVKPPPEPPTQKATEEDFATALKRADFEVAATILKSLGEGARGPQALKAQAARESQLAKEIAADKNLKAAQDALDAGNFKDAATSFNKVPAETVFASRYDGVKQRLEAQAQQTAEAASASSKKPPQLTSAYMQQQNMKPADIRGEKLGEIQDTVRVMTRENPNEALAIAQDCASLAPKVPECHLMLGVVQAALKDYKASEQAYKEFLTLTSEGYPKRDLVIKALSKVQAASQAQ
ncbi:FHA domain- TPR-repeat-containing protein [Corallococcus coralloides DSM 2259]|uniref:FHA domain-TPR-repeat-containing protein n=1 Tax=Corallococcus coralloides (strain ATCC 25202 / DSM 2259 / NBRC 100086 / M2) TaxID=1144275 RepID=H8ML49_CORCM|nr:FHA domain-containing protein [Corallococcus coralloides]AFE06746.1 FHA domain- TPR-repeat-containing protein [Corallococcus coralloides DSM 2259]